MTKPLAAARRSTRPPRAAAPRAAAALGLLLAVGACGNGGGTDAPSDLSLSASSSSTSSSSGATPALRSACVKTNDDIVTANDAWNTAADSQTDADLTKAMSAMTTLAGTLRSSGKDAHDDTFATKADVVAREVDALKKAEKPAKTIDTTSYNSAVDDLTAYCTSKFPEQSGSAAAPSAN